MVTILRIGHRKKRDKRITTHLALSARAFQASNIIIAGEEDLQLQESINKVTAEWGGDFQISMIPYDDWKPFVIQWKSEKEEIIHLSMYGETLSVFENSNDFKMLINDNNKLNNLLIIVGGKKVPRKVFELAKWNIAIGNQPHSEVSALAVFLDHLNPKALDTCFMGAKREVKPSIFGKKEYKDENYEE
ncbi:MAG: tRNA (cytidine(56)-2'-O)-methyltransferase [Candidatus Heimdallarchaeota archaeon]|nr:tRNA (cytidine(56)-2'-O)-methyltransferase [Candidatus Heimdallarchaeota archaeon]